MTIQILEPSFMRNDLVFAGLPEDDVYKLNDTETLEKWLEIFGGEK